jgi:murein DD-endopeptidase MepM/ murein hydrolase activator NlpD
MRKRILGFAVLAAVAAMGVAGTGAGAQQLSESEQTTSVEAVGASVAHPASWTVEREPYTSEGTRGYTLWRPDTDEAHDHGGKPAMRVALAYELEPAAVEEEVEGIVADYPDLPVTRETVPVADGHEGVAVGLVPGSTPFTRVYVPVNGRVYSINVYAENPDDDGLDAADREALSALRFEQPESTVAALDAVPAANSDEALYPSAAEAREIGQSDDGKGVVPLAADPDEPSSSRSGSTTARAGGERRIAGGCWQAPPRFFVQTQHGWGANDDRGGIPKGWSRIGVPNFWGQYTHGNLGYGRCNEPNWANDMYAVDYPLDRGNLVFSPFSCGKVTFAGRNQSHADYGIFVSIRACNGKYVNLSAHLSGLRRGLSRGDKVTRSTVLGYAGNTGGGNIPVGQIHLHTAFYRFPKMTSDGAPYGGAGLQITRNRYVGTAARQRNLQVRSHAYDYARVKPRTVFCREGSMRCGISYMVSN